MNEKYYFNYDNNENAEQYDEFGTRVAKKKNHKKLMCLLLAVAIVFGAIATGYSIGNKSNSTTIYQSDEKTLETVNVSTKSSDEEMTAAEVYASYVNSTVGITTEISTNYFGFKTTSAASGSGFIITSDGYIVTNHHVIEDADSVKVTMFDGTTYDATIIGYDESNDIAVIKIDATGLETVILGDSELMSPGDEVVTIGNPLGELTFSITKGIISAMNREITLSEDLTMNLIQTDCAINSGNSGGAMFNMYGEVIGITNAKYCDSSSASVDNIGFAIPISDVKDIIQNIIETGYTSDSEEETAVQPFEMPEFNYGFSGGNGRAYRY